MVTILLKLVPTLPKDNKTNQEKKKKEKENNENLIKKHNWKWSCNVNNIVTDIVPQRWIGSAREETDFKTKNLVVS